MNERGTYEGQKAFNFYLVALNFAVLGVSVEKALVNPPWLASVLQVAAWACLLASGLLALSYVEWSSKIMDLHSIEEKLEGRVVVSGYYQRLSDLQKALEADIAGRWIGDKPKYEIAKWGFTTGILLLAGARVLAQRGG